MAFLVLCAPKALESDPEHHHLHARHARAQELQEELTSLLEPDAVQELAKKGLQLQVREGGVAAALGPAPISTSTRSSNGEEHHLSQHAQQQQQQTSVWIAGRDERIAVFQGHLKNLRALEAKYLPDTSTSAAPHHHHHHPDAPPEHMPPVPETAPAPPEEQQLPPKRANGHSSDGPNGSGSSGGGNPAAVVLAMYEAMGASLLGHLQGRFAMCMFDAVQMRVLAARDGSGAVPLLQSRTPRGGMVLSSCVEVLACCHDTLEFAPGFFKYGWLAAPRLFTPQALQHPTSGHNTPRRSLDLHHHPHHPHPHYHKENGGASANGSRRASMDHATPPGSAGRSSSAHKPQGGGKGSRRASLDHGTSTPPLSGQGQGQQGSRRCSTDAGAAPPLPHSAGRSREGGGHQGRGTHSPTRSTSSSGSAGNGHPPTGRRRPATEAPNSSGGAASVGAATAGLSHLRVEAAPFVPGAATGK